MISAPDEAFATAVLDVVRQTLTSRRPVERAAADYAVGCDKAAIPPSALAICAAESLRLTTQHCRPAEALAVFAEYSRFCLLYSRGPGPEGRDLTERTLHRLAIAYDMYRRISQAFSAAGASAIPSPSAGSQAAPCLSLPALDPAPPPSNLCGE